MSKLAAKLPAVDEVNDRRVRKGPNGACEVYGDGDLEDFVAVRAIQSARSWPVAQREVDKAVGVKPIDPDKFRYHWNGRCWHWTAEQKAEIAAIRADQ